MNNPNPAFVELRKDWDEAAHRAKRKANIAAEERREKMRPFVESFLQTHGFERPGTIYKALVKLPGFKAVLPKGVNDRPIKSDIEAILLAIDTEAELAHKAGLNEWDLS